MPEVRHPKGTIDKLAALKSRLVERAKNFERAYAERAYIAKRQAKQARRRARIEERESTK